MSESAVGLTPGSGLNIAGFVDTAGNIQQIVMLGDGTNNLAGIGNNLLYVTPGGNQVAAVASAKTSVTVIKNTGGRLCKVLITASGTNAMSIFDNATTNTGTVIGAVTGSAAVGSVFTYDMLAANGITVGGNASNPGVTISFA